MQAFIKFLCIAFLLTSCDKELNKEVGKQAESKAKTAQKEEIIYELVKVDNKENFDVLFKIKNQTSKPKTFVDMRTAINANFVVQKKFLMDGEAPKSKAAEGGINTTVLNLNLTKDGWENPPVVLGIAIEPEKFELKPGEEKEFFVFSAYSSEELDKALNGKNSNSVLLRAEYTNEGDDPVLTNTIELK